MSTPTRIYLDNAATSFPKPADVYRAVDDYNRRIGVSIGRSAYRQAVEARGVVERCRKRAAELLGAESPERVIFTFNGTDGLNLALSGLLRAGDHVVTSVVEHNSVLRPLRHLQSSRGVDVSYVRADNTGRIDANDVAEAVRPETKLIAIIHASNVTGAIQPIHDVGELAHKRGVLFLVDAAQTAGHLPINVRQIPVDLLACSGHKGLLGPLGTGLLYVRLGVEERLESLRQGGTGSQSELDQQPDSLPDKYESGNHNAPGLFGLDAAIAYLQEQGIERIQKHEREMTALCLDGLRGTRNLTVYGPPELDQRVGVISVTIRGMEPQVIASILDENFHIQIRAGLHCAPRVHRRLGTLEQGGTVRLSFGPFNTADDVQAAVGALREIAKDS